jgi:hypothetical protein
MTTDNDDEPILAKVVDTVDAQPGGVSPERAAYNVVTDVVTGVNVRGSDNRFQAVFILVTIVLLAAVGALLARWNRDWQLPWYGGALFGAFAGLVAGFFASGIFLMIYRAVRHIQGKHE